MYCMHSQKDTKVHRQLIRTSKVKSSSRTKCIGTKSGNPFCFLQYGFLSATLGGAKASPTSKDIFISLKEEKTTLLFPYQKGSFDHAVHEDKEA